MAAGLFERGALPVDGVPCGGEGAQRVRWLPGAPAGVAVPAPAEAVRQRSGLFPKPRPGAGPRSGGGRRHRRDLRSRTRAEGAAPCRPTRRSERMSTGAIVVPGVRIGAAVARPVAAGGRAPLIPMDRDAAARRSRPAGRRWPTRFRTRAGWPRPLPRRADMPGGVAASLPPRAWWTAAGRGRCRMRAGTRSCAATARARSFVPVRRASGSRTAAGSSPSARSPGGSGVITGAAHAASKGGVEAPSRSMAQELARRAITVDCGRRGRGADAGRQHPQTRRRLPTDRHLARHRARAPGGAALVPFEGIGVHRSSLGRQQG